MSEICKCGHDKCWHEPSCKAMVDGNNPAGYCECPSFTARPDEPKGDKPDGQAITDTLEGRALSMAVRPIVSKGDLADLLVEFATKELQAERTRREAIHERLRQFQSYTVPNDVIVMWLDKWIKAELAQDSADTRDEGADLSADHPESSE